MTEQSIVDSTERGLASLWPTLPWPASIVGTDHITGRDRRQSKLEVVEALAAVLWRLQVVRSLGPLSTTAMDDDRTIIAKSIGEMPWQTFGSARPVVSATTTDHQLQIVMTFEHQVPQIATHIIGTSLLADAAIRLGGIRGVFARIAKVPRALDRRAIEQWIKAGENRTDRLLFSGALVLAFRDAYMHAAVADSTTSRALEQFRSTMWQKYSQQHLFDACVIVWVALQEAATEITA